jgi:hypothetical protein
MAYFIEDPDGHWVEIRLSGREKKGRPGSLRNGLSTKNRR